MQQTRMRRAQGRHDPRRVKLHTEIKQFIDYCLRNRVAIEANQKVIDAEIREKFCQHGILALEQFGTMAIKKLQRVSRIRTSSLVTSSSCLSTLSSENESMGTLDTLDLFGKKSTVQTLLIHHWDINACEELQVSLLS